MPSEKYEPSYEEIEKGQESMTDTQAGLSERRLESSRYLKGMGVEGYLEWDRDVGDVVTGIINGHKIRLEAKRSVWQGMIDDVYKLEPPEASRFMDKYNTIAGPIANYSRGEVERAQKIDIKTILEEIGL